MELIKVVIDKENLWGGTAEKAKKLHKIRPNEWTVIRDENSLKIIQTLRVYMNEGYLPKLKMKQMKLENGERAIKFD